MPAAYPAIAYELRNADHWITSELARALPEPDRGFRARSLLTLIEHAALALMEAHADLRAECAGMLARMASTYSPAAPHTLD